jgi:hypothetical protein
LRVQKSERRHLIEVIAERPDGASRLRLVRCREVYPSRIGLFYSGAQIILKFAKFPAGYGDGR